MKTIFLCSLLFVAFFSGAQDTSIVCSGLPFANPQVKAKLLSKDLLEPVNKIAKSDFEKGTAEFSFKLFVNCKGDVTEVKFHQGNLKTALQAKYSNEILKLKFAPAENKGAKVNSVVFLTVNVTNGMVEVDLM